MVDFVFLLLMNGEKTGNKEIKMVYFINVVSIGWHRWQTEHSLLCHIDRRKKQ